MFSQVELFVTESCYHRGEVEQDVAILDDLFSIRTSVFGQIVAAQGNRLRLTFWRLKQAAQG